MASRRDAQQTHTFKASDPTTTVGSVHQPDSQTDQVEFSLQAGRKLLVQDVRQHFVPVGQRHKMEGDAHHIVSNQHIRMREKRREAQNHGVDRMVLKDVHDRTHHNDGSLITKKPSVLELLTRFPAESQDEMVLIDENIGQMPTQMEILKHIRKVDLSDNKIHKLSEGIADIEGLEELILINNRLTELPKNLRTLSRLRILNAKANHIVLLPDMLGLKSLQNLNVSDNDLEYINASVQGLSALTEIDVRYCQLRAFPDALCDLQENLCTVRFDYNFILHFPKPIGRLGGLRSLNLSKNELTTLPVGCIEYMTGLHRLDLSQNQLLDIPQTIGINQGLRELILNNNQITLAPRSLIALTGLVKLNLASNRLTRLPEITTLTCLRELHLENNYLERIPVRLYHLTRLEILDVRGNDTLHTPPLSVAFQGRWSIFQWLEEEDARQQKAGMFDSRLKQVMIRFLQVFPTKERLVSSFIAADEDASGTMTLIELDEWTKSLGIRDLSFKDIQFLGNSIDKDNSGFVEVDEIAELYERFRDEKVIREEEDEEMDEEYLLRARAALVDEEMNQAANAAAEEAAEARRKFEQRRKAKETANAAAAAQ